MNVHERSKNEIGNITSSLVIRKMINLYRYKLIEFYVQYLRMQLGDIFS